MKTISPNVSVEAALPVPEAGGGYAISARELGKRYAKGSFAKRGFWSRRKPAEEFWALKPLSFDVRPGEGIGIIGGNGAGKSTLLKILARIVPPTTGEVRMQGRLNSLLEVGTGFQRELSGRANIFLNAAILGLSRAETAERFDEIVAFSGVGEFIDMPVAHYSSGMYSRLAFSIAAHVTGDILLVDEVLSVGDAEFRRRSLTKMEGLMRGETRTVLFVSHSMDAVLRFCDRVIWLDHGEMRAFGPADDVVRDYLTSVSGTAPVRAAARSPSAAASGSAAIVQATTSNTALPGDESGAGSRAETAAVDTSAYVRISADQGVSDADGGRIERIALIDPAGAARTVFFRDEPIHVFFTIQMTNAGIPVSGLVSVRCAPRKGVPDEVVVFADCGPSALLGCGKHTISAVLPRHFFASGTYFLTIGLVTSGRPMLRHHLVKRVLSFQVVDREDESEVLGTFLRGVVRPRLIWSTDSNE